jgi:hypothetical protein
LALRCGAGAGSGGPYRTFCAFAAGTIVTFFTDLLSGTVTIAASTCGVIPGGYLFSRPVTSAVILCAATTEFESVQAVITGSCVTLVVVSDTLTASSVTFGLALTRRTITVARTTAWTGIVGGATGFVPSDGKAVVTASVRGIDRKIHPLGAGEFEGEPGSADSSDPFDSRRTAAARGPDIKTSLTRWQRRDSTGFPLHTIGDVQFIRTSSAVIVVVHISVVIITNGVLEITTGDGGKVITTLHCIADTAGSISPLAVVILSGPIGGSCAVRGWKLCLCKRSTGQSQKKKQTET